MQMSTTRRRSVPHRRRIHFTAGDGELMVEEEEPAAAAVEKENDDALGRDVESLYGWIKYVSRRHRVADRSKPMMQIVAEMEEGDGGAKKLCEEYTSDLAELAEVAKDWDILATDHLFRLCMADPGKAKEVGAPELLVRLAEARAEAMQLQQQQQQAPVSDDDDMDMGEEEAAVDGSSTSGGAGANMTPEEQAMESALNQVFPSAADDNYDAWVVRAHATLYLYSLRVDQ